MSAFRRETWQLTENKNSCSVNYRALITNKLEHGHLVRFRAQAGCPRS